MPRSLFFEKSLKSFQALADEVELLDLDSGIRTFGDYQDKKRQFVFVTRSPNDSYTLMVYGKKAGSVPGKRLLVKEFRNEKALMEFMRGIVSKPVKAFLY